jgi:hypothetical protein
MPYVSVTEAPDAAVRPELHARVDVLTDETALVLLRFLWLLTGARDGS